MTQLIPTNYSAFEGNQRIVSGDLSIVILQVKQVIDSGTQKPVLIFNDITSEQFEFDFRGTVDEVMQRLSIINITYNADTANHQPCQKIPDGPGRPKLGVVSREVTLLPRHWEWLNSQPGGASVALRKLVEMAKRDNEKSDRLRLAQESSYRFISVMAGDLPGFEEASRALFANNQENFNIIIAPWPNDIREHAIKLAMAVFS